MRSIGGIGLTSIARVFNIALKSEKSMKSLQMQAFKETFKLLEGLGV